ncbi:MAG: NAD(+) diphosphatase [Clostridia bacterium]|nr:NAD(+) diphosphatase [Clostridia bacterium]
MIQDIAPHVFHNEYHPDRRPKAEDHLILYREGAFALKMTGDRQTMDFPRASMFPESLDEAVYLFEMDGQAWFALPEIPDVDRVFEEQGLEWVKFAGIRRSGIGPKWHLFALYTAYHLMEWYTVNRYCGKCGGKMEKDRTERAMFCPVCKRKVYPRINPAVIIGVINGDRLLLTRYRNGNGMNALVAGFTEIGESFEETVAREVMEETGLRVRNIRYYKSQPWGIAEDILAGYYCEVDGDDRIRMDQNELRYAEWVKREEIELQPQSYSLTNEMMQEFKEGRIRALP